MASCLPDRHFSPRRKIGSKQISTDDLFIRFQSIKSSIMRRQHQPSSVALLIVHLPERISIFLYAKPNCSLLLTLICWWIFTLDKTSLPLQIAFHSRLITVDRYEIQNAEQVFGWTRCKSNHTLRTGFINKVINRSHWNEVDFVRLHSSLSSTTTTITRWWWWWDNLSFPGCGFRSQRICMATCIYVYMHPVASRREEINSYSQPIDQTK